MNQDYEQTRRELLERQTEEALAEEGSTDFKRHHAYIERLKGKEPGRGTELLKVLTVVRAQGAPLTSDVAIARALATEVVVRKLRHLQERGLIARQLPLQVGVGSWEGTWTEEQRD